jgi:hypothetical protein
LADDVFEHFQVGLEGALSGSRDLISRASTCTVCRGGLVFTDITFLGQGAEMGDEIAIAHAEFAFEFLESSWTPGREQCHDGKPGFLMDDTVELGEVDQGMRVELVKG